MLTPRQSIRIDRKRPHAVIIGSGFGGLAAAIRLGARGYRVTVLERLDAPGGRAYVYRQDGFTFDAGPTIVTAPFMLEDLWRLCGCRLRDDVELRPVAPFYRVRFHDGAVFTYSGDAEAMRAEVARFCPADVAGYERFMRTSEAIFKVGFERLGHVAFGSWTDMARVVPELVRLASYRTVYGLVSRHLSDPRLRVVFSFHPLLIGGNPLTTTSIYSLIAHLEWRWGVHFAMGGTGRLVQGLVRLIERQGGEVRCGEEVRAITTRGRAATGVRLASGGEIASDIVVSNADSAWTYRYLLPSAARRRWTDRRIERARYSMSLFVWYFGTRRRYPEVAHHTILLGPRYRELLADIFDRGVLADDFSLYLHAPTVSDPSLAPDGCEAFYVLSPVPHLGKAPIDWAVEGPRYRDRILDYLEARCIPGLRADLATVKVFTPDDFATDLNAHLGSAFSLEPILTQSAFFRVHNRDPSIGALYFVGAGTHPGAGVPGVVASARATAGLILDDHGIRRPSAA